MCSILTHPAVPLALSAFLPPGAVSAKLLIVGALCSVVPDADVIGFRLGVDYGDVLGHRGLTHSVFFAALLAPLLASTLFRRDSSRGDFRAVSVFLFLSTLSHALLDMLTNGGLGVALLAPFSGERYFFPLRPVEVSPIGVGNFFSQRGLRVVLSELKWVWLPAAVVASVGYVSRRHLANLNRATTAPPPAGRKHQKE